MKQFLIFLLCLFTVSVFGQSIVNTNSVQTIYNKTAINWGQIAVGTNSPQATLHVRGTFQLDSTSAQDSEWQFYDSTGNKFVSFKTQTIGTNVVFILPSGPGVGGLAHYSLSQATNLTMTIVPMVYEFALSDETTSISTGAAKLTWRAPHAMTIVGVRASLSVASSSGTPTVDINEGGTSIFSTTLSIDANEKTSTTAATAAVISDTAIADDAEITFDIDVSGTGARGLKVKLYYTR
jgi:hypothetical protein